MVNSFGMGNNSTSEGDLAESVLVYDPLQHADSSKDDGQLWPSVLEEKICF